MKENRSALLFFGAFYSLFAWTQLNWAFNAHFYNDLALRLGLSVGLAVFFAWIVYLVWALPLRAVDPSSDTSGAGILKVHNTFYLFWIYPFHFKLWGTLPQVNDLLVPIIVSLYLISAGVLVFCLLSKKQLNPRFELKQILIGSGRLFSRAFRYIRYLGHASLFRGIIRFYPLTWLLIVLQLVFVNLFTFIPAWEPIGILKFLLPGLLATVVYVMLVKELSFGHRLIAGVFSFLLTLWYLLLYIYHASAGIFMNFMLVYSNLELMLYPASWKVILSNIPPWGYTLLLAAAVLVGLAEWKFRLLSSGPEKKNALLRLSVVIPIFFLLPLVPGTKTDEVTSFNASIIRYFFYSSSSSMDEKINQVAFPFVGTNELCFKQGGGKPNVFIIFMESFSSEYVNARTEDGKEITPVINRLMKEGLNLENFYGNSVQTAKGQFVTFNGLLPSIRHKEFMDYEKINIHSLPKILREHGWYTFFMKAYSKLSFDNTGEYVKRIGFQEAHGMDQNFLTPEDSAFIWGWGIQDDLFFRKCFNLLDADRAKRTRATKDLPPYFMALTTVSHHMMFDRVPDQLKKMYPSPKNATENFINSIHVADGYIAEFFVQLKKRDYLKNSIVIVMGDHGFPAGQHGLYHNEQGYYEEFFRTPCIILWPGRIGPENLTKGQFSQVNIAPTILDLLGLRLKNHFVGRSVFCDKEGSAPVLLVQPYSEGYLCAIKWPYKLVRVLSDNTEKLYDLRSDPMEKKNILSGFADEALLKHLRKETEKLNDNERLLKENRIWKDL